MKATELSGKRRPLPRWATLAASTMFAVFLAACGGDDGAPGAPGAPGTPGAPGAPGTPGADANATVKVGELSAEQWAAANFKAEVTGVTIASAPVVSFKVVDGFGKPVVGLGSKSQSSTATLPSYPNLAFALAKLVPGAAGSQSKWVSYIVTTVPTKNATTGAITAAAPTRPSTDNTGTLVDNQDGTYKYTFYRDITAIKDQVAAMTVTGANKKEDLGDLSYAPALPHRLTIQISGNAPGTGSNTANGTTLTPGVALANPLNVIYDFVPATGKAIAKSERLRDLVAIESCNGCHEKLAFHGGGRVDADYCVVCHTDQRRYGYANVASSGGKFPALTETASVNAATGITSYSYAPETRVADGEVAGDFTTMIHKIHQGKELVKDNYNYANVAFNNKGYSMLGGGQKMCSTCHDSSKATNADNWNLKPSRQACGACHDGINWATGGGSTLGDKAAATAVGATLATTGHFGGAAIDDAACGLCHRAAAIKVYHQTENITKHNPTIADGLATFTYDIKSVAVNAATNDLTIEFGIRNNGVLVSYVAPAAGVANPLVGFTGSPSFLLAYAQPQDGIAAPADYNNAGRSQAQALSVSIANLLNTANAANGSLAPSAANPGYYIATMKGSGTWKFPVGAKMRAVGLQGYFTQVSPAAARHAISVVKPVAGDAVRRTIVDSAKCSNCHEWFEGHGGNRVYEVQVCVMCHTPGLATSGRGIADAALMAYPFSAADVKMLAGWGFDKTLPNGALKFPVTTNNMKDMIHGIHAGRERVEPFMDARDRTPSAITLLDFKRMDFPGLLNNCQTCHTSSTSATTTYNTVPTNALVSTYESVNAAYAAAIVAGNATPALAKASLATANATDTVTSPFTAACVSCHDSSAAKAHMTLNTLNGVAVQTTRAQAATQVESCATCHGAGADFDTAKVHK